MTNLFIGYARDSGPFWMAFTMMPISAMNKIVKMARKMKNVVCTAPADRLDMAALTGNKSWMAQGCRPTSATTQPAWLATKAQGMLHRALQENNQGEKSKEIHPETYHNPECPERKSYIRHKVVRVLNITVTEVWHVFFQCAAGRVHLILFAVLLSLPEIR